MRGTFRFALLKSVLTGAWGGPVPEQVVVLDKFTHAGNIENLAPVLSDERLNARRDAYCAAIRALHAEGKPARTWPLRFLIRHTAFHTLDHAWEMEDRDLAARRA